MSHAENKTGWWIAAVVLLTVAVLGALDFKNTPYTGHTSPDYVQVSAVSAALNLSVTLGAATSRQRVVALVTGSIGFVFLLCGLGVFTRLPSPTTRLLALLGLCAMSSFTAPPYFESATLRLLYGVFPSAGILVIPALLIHFLLRFKTEESISGRVFAALYVPVAVASLMVTWTLLVNAQLLTVTRAVMIAVVVPQLLIALVVLIRGYVKAGSEERSAYGLHTLLAGFVVGLVPVLVAGFVPSLPGGRYYFFTLAVIPVALAWSAWKAAGQAPGRRQRDAGPRELRTEPARA